MAQDNKGYYKLLDIPAGSDMAKVEHAFKAKMRMYHPEGRLARDYKKLPEPEKTKKMKEIEEVCKKLNTARTVLTDKEKKKYYDQGVDPENMQGGGYNMGGGFEDIFSFFNQGRGERKQRKMESTEFQITVSLDTAFKGAEKKFKVRRRVRCTSCAGKGGETRSTCGTCAGHGRVRKQIIRGHFSTVQEVECEACDGEGEKASMPYCKGCGGHSQGTTLRK